MKVFLAALSVFLLSGFLTGCVTANKYASLKNIYDDCQDTNKRVEAIAGELKNDTLQYGIRYRTLESEKDYLENLSTAQTEHLRSELSRLNEDIETKNANLGKSTRVLSELKKLADTEDSVWISMENTIQSGLSTGNYDWKMTSSNHSLELYSDEKLLFLSGDKLIPKAKDIVDLFRPFKSDSSFTLSISSSSIIRSYAIASVFDTDLKPVINTAKTTDGYARIFIERKLSPYYFYLKSLNQN